MAFRVLSPISSRQITTTLCRSYRTTAFEGGEKGSPDPMQELKRETDADTHPNKVDIGAGVYRTEKGDYYEFESIREAKQRLDRLDLGHDYYPTTGIPSFTKHASELLFGKDRPACQQDRVASVQTIGGTGANRIGAAFLRRCFYGNTENAVAYLGEPAWGNYKPLFENAGFEVHSYQHSARGATAPNHGFIMSSIETAPAKSVFILQASCHNPTGLDYSHTQWKDIAKGMHDRGHFAFFDAAYLGFGSGSADAVEEDSQAIRYFVDSGVDTLICQSFSKTFGMYSERVGALHVVCQSSQIRDNVFDQLRAQTRWEVSSAPAYGARLVDIILADADLSQVWRRELSMAGARIEKNREALHEALQRQGTPGSWEHITKERGLFSFLQLSTSHIDILKKEHHIYLPPNGRVNIAGLSTTNVKRVAEAIHAVMT